MREHTKNDLSAGLAAVQAIPDVAESVPASHYASVESAFATVVQRAHEYEMPHVTLPIDAAEEVLRALRDGRGASELLAALKASQAWLGKVAADCDEGDPTGIGGKALRQYEANEAAIAHAEGRS